MNRTKSFTLLAIVTMGALVVSACGGSTAPTTSSKSLSKTDVTFLAVPLLSYLPIWAAMDQGFFQKRGLNVTFKAAATGQAQFDAVTAGNADFSGFGVGPLALAVDQGAPVKIIMLNQQGTDLTLVVNPQIAQKYSLDSTNVDSLKQLTNSHIKIGVSRPAGTPNLYTQFLMNRLGLTVGKDYTFFYGTDGNELLAQFDAGRIDAYAWFPPLALQGKGTRIPFGVKDSAIVKTAGIVLFTNQAMIKDHPDTVQALVSGIWEGSKFVRDAKNIDRALEILGKHQDIPQDQLRGAYDYSAPAFAPSACPSEGTIDATLQFAMSVSADRKPITSTFKDLTENTFCSRAEAG